MGHLPKRGQIFDRHQITHVFNRGADGPEDQNKNCQSARRLDSPALQHALSRSPTASE